MVTDALWTDFNEDGRKDLIVVGEWMSPLFFQNNGENLEDITPMFYPKISGLW